MTLDERLDQIRGLAKAAYEEGREVITLELMSAYVRFRPDDGYAWCLLGDSLRIIGLLEEAERALLRALEASPDDYKWTVCARLGDLHKGGGNSASAEQWYAQALESPEASNTAWVWIFRGANLACQNQLRAAEDCHRRAATLDDDLRDEALLNLGYVLRAQGRYADAIAAFQEALTITPDYKAALKALQTLDGIGDAVRLVQGLEG